SRRGLLAVSPARFERVHEKEMAAASRSTKPARAAQRLRWATSGLARVLSITSSRAVGWSGDESRPEPLVDDTCDEMAQDCMRKPPVPIDPTQEQSGRRIDK